MAPDHVPSESEVERLRVHFVKSHWRYDRLTPAHQQALVSTKEYAERPQPIDYGLGRGDVNIQTGGRYPLDDGLRYQKDRWEPGFLFLWFAAYICVCTAGLLFVPALSWLQAILLAVPASLIGSFYLCGISEGFVAAYRCRRSEPGYLR